MAEDYVHVSAIGKRMKQQQTMEAFKEVDRCAISRMSDKELAAWQAGFEPESPQWMLANYEWQTRLVVRQVEAMKFAAYIGVAATLLGILAGILLPRLMK
jgi:hypothetical protein